MKLLRQIIRSLATVIFAIAFMSCTSVKDPGAYRASHPIVVGFPGFMYHHSKVKATGLSISEPINTKFHVRPGGTGEGSYSINGDNTDEDNYRKLYLKGWGIETYALVFPWDQSSFFFGMNLEFRDQRIAFNEHTQKFNLDKSMTNVEFIEQAYEFSLVIGASKSFEGGLTMMGGFGPQVYRYANRRLLFEGGEDVDKDSRERTLKAWDDSMTANLRFGAIGVIGQAF